MFERDSFAALSVLLIVVVSTILTGCGGTKLLKEPVAQPNEPVLTTVQDDRLRAELQWVIVRDGPGTWSSPADWDEYVLRIVNKTAQPLVIDEIVLVDSLGTRVYPENSRGALVKASKKTAKRYKKADIKIEAGMTGVGLFGTGTAMMLGGTYMGLQAAFGSLAGTAAGSAIGLTGVVAAYAGPVVIVGGVIRGVNNSKIDRRIRARKLTLPHSLDGDSSRDAHVFYPISPSPELIEIRYTDQSGEHSLMLDTQAVLNGLHLESIEGEGIAVAAAETRAPPYPAKR